MNPEEELQKDLKEVAAAISKVEVDIGQVEASIGRVENEIDETKKILLQEKLPQTDKLFWQDEIRRLRNKEDELREKERELRRKEDKLKNEKRELKKGYGRPPLHPVNASHSTREFSVDTLERKVDQLLEATLNSDRATPQYSAACNGDREKKRLEQENCFSIFQEKAGEESLLSQEQVQMLSTMKNEHQVVAFLTPHLKDVVRDTVSREVFNSEEYKWIQTSSETSIYKYNKKPDLIICHPAIINSKTPFKCEKDVALQRMRRASDQYGVLSEWKLRHSIGVTLEAKQSIDNEAFGEVINYGAHICFGKHAPVMTRLILFDKEAFWLIQSVKGTVASVTTCRWSDCGSKSLMRNFIRQPALPKALDEACQHFNLTVSTDSFLGAGAFGFVFRANRSDGKCVALKISLLQDNEDCVDRLEKEKERMLRAKRECPDEVMGLEEDGFFVFEDGAALLMSTVGEKYSKLSPQSIVDSLKTLHESGIIHGDARLENVVCVDGKPCWIDFADSDFLPLPNARKSEMQKLCTRVNERFGFIPT